MKIEFENCCDDWAEALIEEILTRLDDPSKHLNVYIGEMTERDIPITIEALINEDDECFDYMRNIVLRYWIDEEFPSFGVSYWLYEDVLKEHIRADGTTYTRQEHVDIESGAYKIVKRRGKSKCISI